MKPHLFIITFTLSFLLGSCDPFKTKLSEDDAVYYTSSTLKEEEAKDSLNIMTWNIKFGGGRIDFFFDCIGDRVIMSEEEVIRNMEGVAKFINETQPDLLFVQEIDIDSKRTAFVDQMQWLLDKTHFNYAVYTSQWKASFIPSDGLGRINSGIAIFSRYPLTNARRTALPLMKEQNALVRYFYLKRALLECEVNLKGQKTKLLNTHLEAYSQDGTKKRQLDIVFQRLIELDSIGHPFIFAGDINCLPPNTIKTKGFPDSFCTDGEYVADDYSAEADWMHPFYEKFAPAVPLQNYTENNEIYFTHSVDERSFWNRKLDYIFTNSNFISGTDVTWQSEQIGGIKTMPLSDHCAISVGYGISGIE